MKKLLVIVVGTLLITAIRSFGQDYKLGLQQGSVLIGGGLSVGFGNSKTEISSSFGSGSSKASYFQLSGTPKAMFFVANGVAIGVTADVTSVTAKDSDNSDNKSSITQYSVGPVFRYYAPFGLFAHADFTFGKHTEKDTDSSGTTTDESDMTKWNIGVGYAIFANDFVSVEPSIMYSAAKNKSNDTDFKFTSTLGQFVVGVGINAFIGRRR